MSDIWIDKHSRLKSYKASVKGSKSVVTIEIECDEPGSLGYLLKDLGDIDRNQKLAAERAKQEQAASKKTKQLALPSPPLQIRDMRGDEL